MCLIQVFNQFWIHIEQKSFIFYLDIHQQLPPLLKQSFLKEFNLVFCKGSTFRFLQLIMSVVVKWKYVYLPLYRDIIKKLNKLQKMNKRQIKDLSIHKGNCMQIAHAVLFQITCLQTLASKKIPLLFFHFLLLILDP